MLYFGKSLKLYFQSSSAVTVLCLISWPSAYKRTVISSKRFPSWLFWSFHVLVPLTLTVADWWVFLILNPSILVVYPITLSSFTVYLISFPSLYLGKFPKSYFQFCSLVTSCSAISSPSANKWTLIDRGRRPSWLSSSIHVLIPLIETSSGV